MYVGLIPLLSHFLQLLMIRFTQQNLCCINKIQIENWASVDLVMVI